MTSIGNPWINMGISSQRRVVAHSPHDVFWMTDHIGRYGFLIITRETVINTENSLSLKGITMIKRTHERDLNHFYLVLNSNEDWSIFGTLCNNLTDVIVRHIDHTKMIQAVENQLRRWQRLLQYEPSLFSVEKQMGLFSELMCLKEIVRPRTKSLTDAIKAWGGPDFDKQDFLTSNAVIEVKSHRTSRGEVVSISSAHQLFCEKEPLYLVSYGLTLTESGLSVKELSEEIKCLCDFDEMKVLFEGKLLEYGYAPELIKEPLEKFIVDSVRVYRITTDFPRITPLMIRSQITSVRYVIDLSQCGEFQLDVNEIMEEV